ncbi:MAG: thiolase domain-containing protein [Acidobacteriota bacterium]|nr:thiolase domain-containing protein [Acidobacteriota bacterium]
MGPGRRKGRDVAVVGAGKTPFGAFADKDLRTLSAAAGKKALENANTGPEAVEAFYLGNFAGPEFTSQNHLAPWISTALGMKGIPSTRFEAACASSGSAFFHAFQAVSAGIYDVVMVLGVEKMTCQPTARVTEILAGAGDTTTEVMAGSTFPSLFAMIARRHMHDFGTKREHLAAVAVKNHENGALNPDAQMRKVITLEQAMSARPIAEPLNLYDCSLISDGAAAVVLCAADRAREFSQKPIQVLGAAQASNYLALDEKDDITTFAAVRAAAAGAYEMAGVTATQIEFAEVHDCFTIAEIIAIEDLGFVERGRGGFFTFDGATKREGAIPINASGGLKSKGHPVGATGVAQLCDVVQQLRCEAGGRQLKRHSLGLAQNLGGSGGTCVVTILGRD